jgi:hypothetical protein
MNAIGTLILSMSLDNSTNAAITVGSRQRFDSNSSYVNHAFLQKNTNLM